MDKALTKRSFEKIGVKCAADFSFQPKAPEDIKQIRTELHDSALQLPLILKPIKGGSSVGIHLARNNFELLEFITKKYDRSPYIFEEFLTVDDYCVGIFATRLNPCPLVLPIARINYKGDFFDASIKYEDTCRVEFPTDTNPSVVKAMQNSAIKTRNFIGFNGFSRCDFIVHGDQFFALEVNTHPGVSPYRIVPNMVKHAGLSLGSLFAEMIKEALG